MRLMWYRDHVIEQGKEAASPFSENATTTSSTTISESTISCSSVTRELPDGSKMTAILKPCRSHSEAAPYLLSLAQVPLDPNVDNDMCSLLTDVRAYPCDCVTHIHSAFADRTIIKFDLQSQVKYFFLCCLEYFYRTYLYYVKNNIDVFGYVSMWERM